MAVSNTPPQAYTKELLAEAYQWLASQPEKTRYQARDADSLIRLYLKAKKYAPHSHVSNQRNASFKQELQSLAGMMGDLHLSDEEDEDEVPSEPFSFSSPTKTEPSAHKASQQFSSQPKISSFFGTETNPSDSSNEPQKSSNLPATLEQSTQMAELDAESQRIIDNVQRALNLSRPEEALRMLIRLGAKQVKTLMPDSDF
jgi:hypothetical protein